MEIPQLISFFGLFIMIGVAYLLSNQKRAVVWKAVGVGILLQFVIALLLFKTTPGLWLFGQVNLLISNLMHYQSVGAKFLFSNLSIPPQEDGSLGFFFAFQVLTNIVFFSALMSVLYYIGILQFIVGLMAKVISKLLKTSGAESLAACSSIFVGHVETSLVVKPYLKDMTQSELFCIMTAGMATVTGSLLGAYVSMLQDFFPNIAGHLVTASVMSAPAALVMAKIMVPETERPSHCWICKYSL